MNVAFRADPVNIISLCTGGAGLDLGVELAVPDARIVCMVEREAFLAGHLVAAMQRRFMAPAPVWSDVRTFDGRAWRGAVDGVIGGIPCQPHSLAGKRLGRADERDLWSPARRIIVQSGAWFAFIENVPGMLSSGGADRVRRDLHRLGFEVEGGLFKARQVGASHERERIFILAVADGVFHLSQRGRSGEIHGACGSPQGEARIGQWSGADAGDGCQVMADALGLGDETGVPAPAGGNGFRAEPAIADDDRNALADTSRQRSQVDLRQRGNPREDRSCPAAPREGRHMDDAPSATGGVHAGQRRSGEGATDARRAGVSAVADADAGSQEIPEGDDAVRGGWSKQPSGDWTAGRNDRLFPPGPGDVAGWRGVLDGSPELEPAFRRVADGMAAGLDAAQSWARVDRLRMLGNGVVSLEAAYALRTLSSRLAARGSAGADFLVRAMRLVTGEEDFR